MATKPRTKKVSPKTTNILEKPAVRRLILALGIVVIVLFAFYVVRGWLRATVVPSTVGAFQLHSIQAVADEELAKLDKPFSKLGFDNPENTTKDCSMNLARKVSETVGCTYTLHAYGTTPRDDTGKQALNANAAVLQKILQSSGWEGAYNENAGHTSLTTLVKNLTQGIDYTPDATYSKTIGAVTCRLSATTAFASPNPAAINVEFACTKTVNIFGGVDPADLLPAGADVGPSQSGYEGL